MTGRDVVLVGRLSPALALVLAMLGAAACGQSTFPAFTGTSGKDASSPDVGTAGGGGTMASGLGGSSSGGGGGLGTSGAGGRAPGTGGAASGGRTGTGGAGSGGATAPGSGGATTPGSGGSGTGGNGGAAPLVTVTVSIVGGPSGTSITPLSPTPGSSCAAGHCTIPVGGAVMATAPTFTNWAFDGWRVDGIAYTNATMYQRLDLDRDLALTATFINQRMETCRDLTPDNAMTTSRPLVMTTYSAGAWSTPATCPWMCLTGFCTAGASCLDPYVDAIALTGESSGNRWFGGDDRPDLSRSVGDGQSVTPSTPITMARFGLYFQSPFTFDSSGKMATSPILLELDRRDANGTIQATYSTMVDPQFKGGWVFWDTPATALGQGVVYIFTSFMTNAFTQPVSSGVMWSKAAYAGGTAYTAEVTSGDLKGWSSWYSNESVGEERDLLFRVQQKNPACK